MNNKRNNKMRYEEKLIKNTVNIDIEYQGTIKKFGYGNVHITSMLRDIEKCLNEIAREELIERLENE